jgi:hypothetical protein
MSSTDDISQLLTDDAPPLPPRHRPLSDLAATGETDLRLLPFAKNNPSRVYASLPFFLDREYHPEFPDTLPYRLFQHIEKMRLFVRMQKGFRTQLDTLNAVLKRLNQWPTASRPYFRELDGDDAKPLAKIWYDTVKADSNTCTIQMKHYNGQYNRLVQEFRMILQDLSFNVSAVDAAPRRMTLEYLLRKAIEKKYKEMDKTMEILRDATRLTSQGVVGFYVLCNPVTGSIVRNKRALLDRDRWAEQVVDLFLLALADMKPVQLNMNEFPRSVYGYITDPRIIAWAPKWLAEIQHLTDWERRRRYGNHGSGWWGDNTDDRGRDHVRDSEENWANSTGQHMYRSWGTRRLPDLVAAEQAYLRKIGGDPSTVTEPALYPERYALLARLRAAKGDEVAYDAVLSDMSTIISEYNTRKPASNPNIDQTAGAGVEELLAIFGNEDRRSESPGPEKPGNLRKLAELRKQTLILSDENDHDRRKAHQRESPLPEGTCSYQPIYYPREDVVGPALPAENLRGEDVDGLQWLQGLGKNNWRWRLAREGAIGAQSGISDGLSGWESFFATNPLGTWQPRDPPQENQGTSSRGGEVLPPSDPGTTTSIDGWPALVTKGKVKSENWLERLPEVTEMLPASDGKKTETEPCPVEAPVTTDTQEAVTTPPESTDRAEASAAQQDGGNTDVTSGDGSAGPAAATAEASTTEQDDGISDAPSGDRSAGPVAGGSEVSSASGSIASKLSHWWNFGKKKE